MKVFLRLRLFAMTALGMLVSSGALRAGANIWTGGGPEETFVLDIAVHPTNPMTVYVAGIRSLYKTTDGGANWTSVPVFPQTFIRSVGIDPMTPTTIYAGNYDGRIFKSVDSGQTWFSPGPGVADQVVGFAFNTGSPATVYAFAAATVYRSTDGGVSWSGSAFADWVEGLTVESGSPAILYAAVSTSGVYRSSDGGLTWSNVSTGPIAGAYAQDVKARPAAGDIIYAAAGPGVYKSIDGGASWIQILSSATKKLAVTAASPNLIYAAVYQGGVLRSSDGGMTWHPTGPGPDLPSNIALATAPSSAATLYAGNQLGFYRTTDAGTTWTKANHGFRDASIAGVAVDPIVPSRVYAGVQSGLAYRSLDSGQTWSEASSGLNLFSVSFLALANSSPTAIYIGGDGLFKSTDAATSWSQLPFPVFGPTAIAIDPATPSTLYVGTPENGVYKSVNAGASWSLASSGLAGGYVLALAIDPAETATIYAGTLTGGVFKSVNGGASWNQVLSLRADRLATAAGPPTTVFAAIRASGLLRSTDGGATWTSVGTGSPLEFIDALAVDPADPKTLYAGTEDQGIFKSLDSGQIFFKFSAGLPGDVDVFSFGFSPNGRTIVAGMYYGSAFTYSITAGYFYSLTPCRLADTRGPTGPYGGPALNAGTNRNFTLVGECGIPANATALALNFAVTGSDATGHLTAYQGGTNLPLASTINYRAGQTRANNASLPLGAAGDLAVFCGQSTGTTHLIIDVTGYFAP